jgi:uncharacterized protein
MILENSDANLKATEVLAERGDIEAMETLFEFYDSDYGSPNRDLHKAHYWCEKLAGQTSTQSDQSYYLYRLGFNYLNGQGIEQNWDLAIHWLTKSAELEVAELEVAEADGDDIDLFMNATELLAEVYANPNNPLHSFERSAFWYEKSWTDDAAFELGMMYMKGVGVKKDTKKAKQHLNQALEGNLPLAKGVMLALASADDYASVRIAMRHDR